MQGSWRHCWITGTKFWQVYLIFPGERLRHLLEPLLRDLHGLFRRQVAVGVAQVLLFRERLTNQHVDSQQLIVEQLAVGTSKKVAIRKVVTRKVLLFQNPKSPLYIRPNLTQTNHVVQSYAGYALTPAAGCQDLSRAYF